MKQITTVEAKIRQLATAYAEQLRQKIVQRIEEMQNDDRSHFLIYQVLGITDEEGRLIDIYQNKGRFLYRYAGTFLENAAKLCLQEKYPGAGMARIPNSQGRRPATFEIDYLKAKMPSKSNGGTLLRMATISQKNIPESEPLPKLVIHQYGLCFTIPTENKRCEFSKR